MRSLWSLPPQLGLGISGRPHPRRSGEHSRLPISDAGKCLPPIPPHPWTAAPIQGQGWGEVGEKGKARVGNVVWITLQDLDPAPCSEDSGPSRKVRKDRKVQAFQKFLNPLLDDHLPPAPLPRPLTSSQKKLWILQRAGEEEGRQVASAGDLSYLQTWSLGKGS